MVSPFTPAEICRMQQLLDNDQRRARDFHDPLHHKNRCPIHGPIESV